MAVLRIELLEDCEMNSGRTMNSLFSDDVFFDGFGLPYLPAWVVRNSLARAAEGAQVDLDDESVEALVGRHASLVLDDALVADRESMRAAILSSPYSELLLRNPQSVLNASGFTKVKKSSGAQGNTYVRLLTKGTIFEAYFELDTAHLAALRHLVAHVAGLYVGYTVRARFTLDENWERPRPTFDAPVASWEGERLRLNYDLHVISHMTSLNHVTGELDAEPYVTGWRIRDALASRPELAEVLIASGADVRCSYAYIGVHGRRGLPIPASYSTKKQDKNDLRDRCSRGRRPSDFDQIKGMGTLFIDDPDNTEVHAMGVRKEQAIIQYYSDGAFRSTPYCAVGHAQTFKGFIEGPADEVRRIYESLIADGYIRVGHLSNLGFGNAYVQVRSVAPLRAAEPVLVEEATVLLASPTRLYRGGLYEPSAQNVLEEIRSRLACDAELEIVTNSQKTCPISNFNQAWGELEPLEYAMQAGSIYRLRAKDRGVFDIGPVMGGIFIGGHTDTGYGETWVMPAVDAYYRHITYDDTPEGGFVLAHMVDPNAGRRLMRSIFQNKANTVAAHLGAVQADAYVREEFDAGALRHIRRLLGDDYDLEQVFEAYMDAIKESGLNAIRRGFRD